MLRSIVGDVVKTKRTNREEDSKRETDSKREADSKRETDSKREEDSKRETKNGENSICNVDNKNIVSNMNIYLTTVKNIYNTLYVGLYLFNHG